MSLHTYHLPAGETRRLRADAGTLLLAQGGSATLWLAPKWLSEHLLRPGHELADGECHHVEESGWIELQAGPADVQLLVEAPQRWSLFDLLGPRPRGLHDLRPLA